MPRLPKTTYTRPHWQIAGGGMYGRYGSLKPRIAEPTWIPQSKLRLREAVAFLGEKKIAGWNGSEPEARLYSDKPDRPWLYFGGEDPSGEYLIFDDDGSRRFVDEADAEAWWSEIEIDIVAEWKAEKEAAERWKEAVDLFRSLLAEKTIYAELLSDSGSLVLVDPREWLAGKAASYFRDGVGEISIANDFNVFKHSGAFLIDRSALDAFLSGKTEMPAQQVPAADIDATAFPYLAFMLRAAREFPFNPSGRTLKKTIEAWLTDNWPAELGDSTQTKIQTMATFLRRPEDEAGGIHRSKSDKAPD